MNRWFHPEFESDLIAAARYYEVKRVGLGGEFLDAAEAAIEAIMTAPHRWPEGRGGIRRIQLDRFPFLVRYRIRVDTVEFLSILHGARDPDTGKDRE